MQLKDERGNIFFAVTTASNETRAFFNQGIRYISSFDFDRAILSFRKAESLDPSCVMCLWGESFALGLNLNSENDSNSLESVSLAFERVSEATRLLDHQRSNYEEIEQDLVAALSVRYLPEISRYILSKSDLDLSFAYEMDKLAEKYGFNEFVLTVAANAWMNTRPWDYWKTPIIPYDEGKRAKDLLEMTLSYNSENIYAIHLYISVMEASSYFSLAVPYADKLPSLAPDLPHLQHMPSHIYMHTGNWDKVVENNAAASKFGPLQLYPLLYLEFELWALRMQGNSSHALRISRQLFETVTQREFVGPQERLASALVLTQITFSKYDDVLKAQPPNSDAHFWCLLWHYSRGLAFLYSGHQGLEAALHEYSDLQKEYELIEKALDLDADAYGGLPVLEVGQIARLVLESQLASDCSDEEKEIRFLRTAWELEKRLPYDEPPIWPMPVAHKLGASLKKYQRTDEAWLVFEDVLSIYPKNGWALYGIVQIVCESDFDMNIQVQNLADDESANDLTALCAEAVSQFKEAWANADVDLYDSGSVNDELYDIGMVRANKLKEFDVLGQTSAVVELCSIVATVPQYPMLMSQAQTTLGFVENQVLLYMFGCFSIFFGVMFLFHKITFWGKNQQTRTPDNQPVASHPCDIKCLPW